ncbi:hypothetical protein HJC23_006921 [Cyclotella cryptica]|uniref:Uncharacterized protein n=1 Tax=Cyclotella cryptica TaxID=29204 RepID=A0ABD3QC42_9STRA|eukprot:CCRYP_006757-RA/>CCRYP_006757-RA protein AED:0.39 eAED:0.39 QI:0/-1/0/1/-1/1/1/0/379
MKTLGKDRILSRLLPCALVFLIFIAFSQFREPCIHLSNNDAKVAVTRNYNPLKKVSEFHYEPSMLENYFIVNLEVLGLRINNRTRTCPLIFNTSSPINDDMHAYFRELDHYNDLMKNFTPVEHDLRKSIEHDASNIEEVCSVTKIHPDGLGGIFAERHASISNTMGAMEPLLPVFRSQKICVDARSHLMSMEYLVHDFYSMCKNLKRDSRNIFVDMGASLEFHAGISSPAVYINQIFRRFGFHFDHIYAYEIREVPSARVYELVPNELMDSFHWMNVGVDPEPGAKLNPFTTLLEKFNSDDFIVVKLDIDTSSIENRLALQLRNDSRLLELVDLFYFEDHRLQEELMPWWRNSANGSIGESLELMAGMRANGVASHYWP